MRILTLDALPPSVKLEAFSVPFTVLSRHIGHLHITACADAVRSIKLHTQALDNQASHFHPQLAPALRAYLAGERIKEWPVAVALPTQPFLLACWQELANIAYGATISYSNLARQAGNPRAIRAAASACARNPVPLLIPCHRVLAKDGGPGGFAWGVEIKQALLGLESKQNEPVHFQKAG